MEFPDDDDLLPSDSFDALLTATGGSPLDALGADLIPPSPILTPSQVAFSWSCGSIPVLLYDEAYVAGGAESDGVISISLSARRPAMDQVHEDDVDAESYDDNGRDYNLDDCDCDSIPGTELADDCVEAFDSPGSGTGSGPSTPRRASYDVSRQRTSTAAFIPVSGIIYNTLAELSGDVTLPRISAIDPVAYQKRWASTASGSGSGGPQPRRADVIHHRKPSTGLEDSTAASGSTSTAKPDVQGNPSRESGLRARASRLNVNEVSRWSADSDSVFLSGSASHLSEYVSAQNKGAKLQAITVNPNIIINTGLSSGSIHAAAGDLPEDDDDNDEDSAFQTPTKVSLKPDVSWISSRSWDYGKYEAYVAREEPSRHALISNSLESYVESLPVSQTNVTPPNKRTALGKRDVNALNIDTPRTGRVGAATLTATLAATGMDRDREHHVNSGSKEGTGTRLGSPRRQSSHPAARVRAPEGLDNSWLVDVGVQLLIDQEGFRAAEPKLRYTGTARVRIGQSAGSRSGTGGAPSTIETVQMAQFRMAKRESYHFHHAPFETPPILRRVTVNGDETHDHVSKQALLTLKVNGVYVLHGQEALVHGHPHSDEATNSKLHWQLEYLVDDRVVDVSQRIMDGEKVLTLLSFSCSPALLLPSQAKRNTLMHVFKKSVAPKLVAEKVQPPGMGLGPSVVGGSGGQSIGAAGIPKGAVVSEGHGQAPVIMPYSQTHGHPPHLRARTYGWAGLHRRGQSHGARYATTHHDLPQKVAAGAQASIKHRTSPSHGHVQYIADAHQKCQHDSSSSPNGHISDHRRRNSSAGERPSLGGRVMVDAPFKMVSSSRHHWEPAAPPPHDSADVSPTRYILPPEQLTKLLDSIAVSDDVKQVRLEREYVGAITGGIPPAGPLSCAITERKNAGARASMGFAPLPAPPRHKFVTLTPKDIPPI